MIDTETWSYTILGNSTGSKFHGAFFDLIIASLTVKENENLYETLSNEKKLKFYIEKCLDTFVSYAFKTKSRLGFQALGVFLMEHGGKMTSNLKKLILKYSKWGDERKQLKFKKDRVERRKYLFDFREKVMNYESGKKIKVNNHTVTDIVNKREAENDNSPIWRRSIDYSIKDINIDIKEYFCIDETEFKLNPFITLKLEEGNTFIYINGEKFIICKHILIDIPVEKVESIDNLKSIDEYIDNHNGYSIHLQNDSTYIPLDLEFWVHCSNMQVWVENNYNSRLLHSNLSFPLLKKLTEVGDPVAKKVFKEEIAKRFESGYIPVMQFLLSERYIKYLNNEEIQYLVDYLNRLIPETENATELLNIKKKILNNYS